MNEVIRKLNIDEIPAFVDIALNAYPAKAVPGPEFRERQITRFTHNQENMPTVQYYGLFRDNRLIAGMRIHEYTMNLYGRMIQVGGVGQVAVDLLHKKEKAAKQLIEFFISHFKLKGISLLLLYPFKPDFYKNMGFGYGTKMNQYRIKPDSLPRAAEKHGLVWLDRSHQDLIRDCSDRQATSTHGMMLKTPYELNSLFNAPGKRLIGYMEDNKLNGYISFTFNSISSDNFLLHDMVIHEFVYETPEALQQLGTFLHTQSDQINRIIWTTQDDTIEYLIGDPRNGSDRILPSVFHESHTSGVGLMYKIIDIEKFIIELAQTGAVYSSKPVTLHFKVTDSFSSKQPNSFALHIEQESLTISMQEQRGTRDDSVIELDISDLSSLLMGVVDADKLYQYGKIKTSDPQVIALLKNCFRRVNKPVCTTAF
ncbi:GNAT family N-acetyltransferase [Paenibacillus sp. N3/727]|uniref:GNAT family N-acetyltransferase n=1 Tax=Paenibacillus sp. N3/727 TaxID=2925845 RepID=UPI001F52D7C7|nr:GNAT family N-acetyltransferase [Paenibacillus sp. N3/727]UNK16428.1 GNAT family N-acetyltransferase [Paenibacillus sp. N3/727]